MKTQKQPNIIDKFVGYFSPIRGATRAKARAYMSYYDSYVSGSTNRRPTSQWTPTSSDADSSMQYHLKTIRNRSHDLVRNSAVGSGIISNVVSNVVGSGLKFQSRINNKILKLDDDRKDELQDIIENEFNLWAESTECDYTRTLDFYGLQDLIFRECLSGGDGLALLPNVKTGNLPYSLCVQILDANRLSNKDNRQNGKYGENYLFEGVEKDRFGRPVKYHISNGSANSLRYQPDKWTVINAYKASSGLKNIIHLFRVLRPGQSRGIPYLSPVIEPIRQLTKYSEAEIDAAVISGMFAVFIESETGDGGFSADDLSDETGATSSDSDIKLAPGLVAELRPGEKISSVNPGRPNSNFDPFVMAIMRQIGIALEIPYEVLIKHFQSSYSAARAALLEAWRFYLDRRRWLANNFCSVIFENFMWEAVSLGRIPAPGFFKDPLIRKAYLGAVWQGSAQGQIDPVKEVSAAEKRLSLFLTTHAEETLALTGGDFDKNIMQRAREEKVLKEIGLKLDPVVVAPAVNDDNNGGVQDGTN